MRVRALVLPAAKEAPVLLEKELPAPGPGEVRLRLEACGLGLGDFNAFLLDAPPKLPVVLGSEAVGRVEAAGPGVAHAVGARLGVTFLAFTCGGCEWCERGLERYCAAVQLHGLHVDGAAATHGLFRAQHLVPVPDSLPAAQVAPLLGAGWAALGALRLAGVGHGQRLAVLGAGGVGHLAIAHALRLGARVDAFDPSPERLALAVSLGAGAGLQPDSCDAALVCTPSVQAVNEAVRALRRTGTLVLVGHTPTGRVDFSLRDAVTRGLTIRGSFLGTRSDLDEVLRLAAGGTGLPTVVSHRLDDGPAQFWALRDQGFVGRLVFEAFEESERRTVMG